MKMVRLVAASALLLGSDAVFAQSANDAQCIILVNEFAKQAKDPNQQKAAQNALFFYLGRIGDGATSGQLSALFDAQMKNLNESNAQAKLEACMKSIDGKVQLLSSLGAPVQRPPAKPADKKPEGR